MKMLILSVRDKATETFSRPHFVSAIGQGVRAFTDEVNRAAEDNVLYKHPKDFDLYEVGAFHDDTGALVPVEPRCVARGEDVKEKVSNA